ncbi:hypothetical protein C6H69_02560 [Photorhabdus luminescens]|nr:hypothetical protein C6H69_02560 [Photorhabdus luminescens]
MKIYWSYFAESHHLASIKKAMEMVIKDFSLTGEVSSVRKNGQTRFIEQVRFIGQAGFIGIEEIGFLLHRQNVWYE